MPYPDDTPVLSPPGTCAGCGALDAVRPYHGDGLPVCERCEHEWQNEDNQKHVTGERKYATVRWEYDGEDCYLLAGKSILGKATYHSHWKPRSMPMYVGEVVHKTRNAAAACKMYHSEHNAAGNQHPDLQEVKKWIEQQCGVFTVQCIAPTTGHTP